MLSVPPLIALLVIDYLKPQEYVPLLAALPLLYIFSGLAVLGFVLDVRQGLSKISGSPQLPWVVLFFVWALVTVAFNAPDQFSGRVQALLVPISLYLIVGHSVQSFRMLQVLAGVILAISLFLSILGVYQGLAPWGCHQVSYAHGEKSFQYDGRDCDPANREVCSAENAEPGADYACEHVGLFATNSDHGRVRYRGTLSDPNELSLVIGVAVPFAFAFLDRKRSLARQALLLATLGLVGVCANFTQSRGGQLVFLAVLGVYFLNRFGRKGLVLALMVALPILLLGGREGAEDSTVERTECWFEGMLMFWHQPLFGVGFAQFTEHHYLTAHNSYVLAAAELGLPGMWLWSAVVYLSVKIPVRILRTPDLKVPPVARSWALAFIASMIGMCVGVFFLSYCYKEFLWIYIGFSAALYQSVRRHAPDFTVKLTARDAVLILAVDVMLILTMTGYTRWKVG